MNCSECTNPAATGRFNEIKQPVCKACHCKVLDFLSALVKEKQQCGKVRVSK